MNNFEFVFFFIVNLFGASATEKCVLKVRPFPTKDPTMPENALFVTLQQLGAPCCTSSTLKM